MQEEKIWMYTVKETNQKVTVCMLKYIFPPAVFLDLQNIQGLMVRKYLKILSRYDEEKKETEIIKQEKPKII